MCEGSTALVLSPSSRARSLFDDAYTHFSLFASLRFRWCVSGTPIGRGRLDDLFGLVHFLDVQPFSNERWWRHAIANPFERYGVAKTAADTAISNAKAASLAKRSMAITDDADAAEERNDTTATAISTANCSVRVDMSDRMAQVEVSVRNGSIAITT